MLLTRIALIAGVLASAAYAQDKPVTFDDAGALNRFGQYEMHKRNTVDALEVASAGGRSAVLQLREGAGAVSVVYTETPITVKSGSKWTLTMDFLSGHANPEESLLGLGITREPNGVLAGAPNFQNYGFLIRVKMLQPTKARFDWASLAPGSNFEVGQPFFLSLDENAGRWYRLSVEFELLDLATGHARFHATLDQLSESGKPESGSISEYTGEFTNPDLFAGEKIYSAFRLDSSTAVPAVDRFLQETEGKQ